MTYGPPPYQSTCAAALYSGCWRDIILAGGVARRPIRVLTEDGEKELGVCRQVLSAAAAPERISRISCTAAIRHAAVIPIAGDSRHQ